MSRTISYCIIITRGSDGYVASSPAFPGLAQKAHAARSAYARLKVAIKAYLLQCIANDNAPPHDPVIQTTTLRIDLWYLKQQEELQ